MDLGTYFERPCECVVFWEKEQVRNSDERLCLAETKLCQRRVSNTTKG